LADKIEKRFKFKSTLIKSRGGAFEVFLNKKKVYSKKQTRTFPTDEQIFQLIENY